MTRTGRRPLRTVLDDDDFDRLPRKRAFESRHPEAFIGMITSDTWQAHIRQKSGETVITRWYLRDLIDELEKRYPPSAIESDPGRAGLSGEGR